MQRALEALGANVLVAPAIELADPVDWGDVDRALRALDSYDWVVFTSANGVRQFAGRAATRGIRLPSRGAIQVAVVGPSTARAAESCGLQVSVCPTVHSGEGLLEALGAAGSPGRERFLLIRPEQASGTVADGLRAWGARVEAAAAYRTVCPASVPSAVQRSMEAGEVDLVAFTSSSAVRNFVELIGPRIVGRVCRRVAAGCIGPRTAETARALGFTVVVEPPHDRITVSGLVTAISLHFCPEPRSSGPGRGRQDSG